jgi:hypothetical protein
MHVAGNVLCFIIALQKQEHRIQSWNFRTTLLEEAHLSIHRKIEISSHLFVNIFFHERRQLILCDVLT